MTDLGRGAQVQLAGLAKAAARGAASSSVEGNDAIKRTWVSNITAVAADVAALTERVMGLEGQSAVPGPPGKDGAAGIGTKGDPGTAGAVSIVPGPPGRDGTNGTNGTNGKDGAPGAAGADGILSIQRARLTSGADGTVTWTYPAAYAAGVVPVISAVCVATGVPHVVQLDGVTNQRVTLRAFRADVLGKVSTFNTAGAVVIHVLALPPT